MDFVTLLQTIERIEKLARKSLESLKVELTEQQKAKRT